MEIIQLFAVVYKFDLGHSLKASVLPCKTCVKYQVLYLIAKYDIYQSNF